MNIELRPIDSIKPYDKNPRRNDGAVNAVANSITAFGFRQPIVVDRDGVIVCGHTRWKAARQLGLTEVPVHEATELTEAQCKAYRLADNRSHELAEWDPELLPIELGELKALDVDLSTLGWNMDELNELMGSAPGAEIANPDDVPEPPPVATTRAGDLWMLGSHRLLCGDSTNLGDVRRAMNGEKAALIATDPPYLIDYTGERPNDSGKDWSATYKEVDITDPDAFFRAVFTNVLDVIAPRVPIYAWHAFKRQAMLSKVWEDLGFLAHQEVVWVKPTAVFGRVYWHFRHEPCMMGWVQGSQPDHNTDHTFNSVWEVDWEGKSRIVGNEHPTQKPVELFARPMRKHTKAGDVCFEPFSGSGSQLIAAEMLGRRCYAMELEPVFVDVAIERWQRATGKAAVLESAGQTFYEAKAECGVIH